MEDTEKIFEIESKLKRFCQFLDLCPTIWHIAIKPCEIGKKRIENIWSDPNANRGKPLDQSTKEIPTTHNAFINGIDNLFNSNGGEMEHLSFLRNDLASMDWDNFFDFDLNFHDVHNT